MLNGHIAHLQGHLNNLTRELNFTTNQTGIFYMNINLSDDEGLWTSDTLIINISANSIPIVESINKTINDAKFRADSKKL